MNYTGFTIGPKPIIMTAIALFVAAYMLPGAFTIWFYATNGTNTTGNALVDNLWFILPLGVLVMLGLAYMKKA